MKTTDLETSKKLKELGFWAETDYIWAVGKVSQEYIIIQSDFNCFDWGYSYKEIAPSYDFETIWEALPAIIRTPDDLGYGLLISKKAIGIGYYCESGLTSFIEKDESLATTAARLLIKLVEGGVIKLGE